MLFSFVQPLRRSISEITLERMSDFLGSLSIIPQKEEAKGNAGRKISLWNSTFLVTFIYGWLDVVFLCIARSSEYLFVSLKHNSSILCHQFLSFNLWHFPWKSFININCGHLFCYLWAHCNFFTGSLRRQSSGMDIRSKYTKTDLFLTKHTKNIL